MPKLRVIANKLSLILVIFFSFNLQADSFENNIYNNHGIVGLINMPTARFYNEGVHGVTIYNSDPVQKMTLTSNPYDWLEASFFYMNLPKERICRAWNGEAICEGYKDKGFNLKLRLKEEGVLPAIAIGLMDFAGTGKYQSEYIVSSYGINKIDMHLGLGWGRLSGSSSQIKNPLTYINDSFKERPEAYAGAGGEFNIGTYFSGPKAAPFYGISYSLNNKTLLKIENDTIQAGRPGIPFLPYRKSNYSFGIDYSINSNFSLSIAHERGNYSSLKFVYKNNPKKSVKKYEYKKAEINADDNKYDKLVKNLEENGIGVNRITETANSLGLELTQFIHPNFNLVEDIIAQASIDAGIKKNIKKDLKIADLTAISEIDDVFEKSAKTIYERDTTRRLDTSTKIQFRPFIASREEFFKGALLAENNTEFVIRENLFFNTNLKYSLWNNFDDLVFPPVDTFPAQVRSDVKQYLKNMNDGVLIGRAQFDYHLTPKINHHLMLTGGILEDMFSGYGAEYLYFVPNVNYSFGVELFKVKKRDYQWGFGHLEYENTTLTANFYYRNYGTIPFDMKVSAGEYLAGDVGSTIEFSRTFKSGVKFGAFATFTDVTTQEFGEGSFDKGIFFKIPIYGNLIDYTWRPLTKDPGATLIRKNTLHDLLIKFRPID
ncbi:YjbH domain-containing protein [Gammaproteobacteria bacterium]|nr:YjbH domain-containing protein [Gammaproteobacteria bacterium]